MKRLLSHQALTVRNRRKEENKREKNAGTPTYESMIHHSVFFFRILSICCGVKKRPLVINLKKLRVRTYIFMYGTRCTK